LSHVLVSKTIARIDIYNHFSALYLPSLPNIRAAARQLQQPDICVQQYTVHPKPPDARTTARRRSEVMVVESQTNRTRPTL
jgi:hypothetical protein